LVDYSTLTNPGYPQKQLKYIVAILSVNVLREEAKILDFSKAAIC